ncbi:MAG: diguanylate cyclase, partial [Clostridiaceae bacterium]|nr:diguanylate cyclase [Clostridiaceae bacterium]
MLKNYKFEELRLYAMFSFILISLIYIGISAFSIPLQHAKYSAYKGFFVALLIFTLYNLIRYRYLNTLKLNSDWVFLIYGSIDLFYISLYLHIPSLNQGAIAVIMFILIMACIYRGRKTGITLTLIWFPIHMVIHLNFINSLKNPLLSGFNKIKIYDRLDESLYFQFMLLILVFITDVVYRQITNKEKDNKRLFSKLEHLAATHDQIEAKNDKLHKSNTDLEDVNKKLTHSVAEFFTLQQISTAIGSILDMDELIKHVNDITLGVMGVKDSTIILFNEKSLKLEVHTTNIADESDYALLCGNMDSNALLRILQRGTVVCDNNVHSSKFNFTSGRNVRSLICAPLISNQKKFGLILIEQNFENAFDIENIRLLTVIAQQVAMAMENADLYHKMHKLAVTDNLTGAYNRVYFHERLNEEALNAEKNQSEVSVAILDIDHFKRFNDTYGHLFGDKVLKSMTDLINQSIRKNDVMARFGGEEFIILFPSTTLDEASLIVEEL